jgi:hypothetical protein
MRLSFITFDIVSSPIFIINQEMKTLFDRMMVQLEWLSHPAGGWLPKTSDSKKRKSRKTFSNVISPECSNIRGGRREDLRKTPAP